MRSTENVVVIADLIKDHSDIDIENRELEYVDKKYFDVLFESLKSNFTNVYHYTHPKDFIKKINKHKNDIVISTWSGQNSINRRTFVPSICEAYGIRYVGADTYANILCQDKALSHGLCSKNGINVPNYRLIETDRQFDMIDELSLPLVVKPNFEGGSIGISAQNLIHTHSASKNLCSKLLGIYKQPIIVEEFIPGREINFIVFGNSKKIHFMEGIELYINSKDINIENDILGFELKWSDDIYCKKYSMELISNGLIQKITKLFKKFEKMELMRIDGRMYNEKFTCIELSPDVDLAYNAEIAVAFENRCYSYSEMLKALIYNAIGIY